MFLGVTLGAMILGRITFDLSQGFFTVFIQPWLNVFSFVMGVFCTGAFCLYRGGFPGNRINNAYRICAVYQVDARGL
jgi:hypothetical protein